MEAEKAVLLPLLKLKPLVAADDVSVAADDPDSRQKEMR